MTTITSGHHYAISIYLHDTPLTDIHSITNNGNDDNEGGKLRENSMGKNKGRLRPLVDFKSCFR